MMSDILKTETLEDSKRFRNEKERQQLRKNKQYVSRFLDNYYNANLFSKSWWPNGVYKIKKNYTYDQTGLCYHYEKNNVIHKLNFQKIPLQNYLEYDSIEDDQFIITIEFCSNCHNHASHTQHQSDQFQNFASHLQKSILIRFPFIKVILKPIDTEIKPEQYFGTDLSKANTINTDIKRVKIGAMEVQLCYKMPKDNKKIYLIHSKLQTGHWPSISNVLTDIAKHMPLFNLNLRVFDSENVKDRYPNLQDEELNKIIGSKIENIKVNLYKIMSKKIEEICSMAKEEIGKITNPKKRIETIENTKREFRESYTSILPAIPTNNYNSVNMNRPSTGIKTNARESIKSAISNMTIFTKENKLIRDKEKIDSLKGELLVSLYTDNNGKLKFINLPYDTYLIEVEESSNYHGCGMIFAQDQIHSDKKVKRFIPVKKQTLSHVKIFVITDGKEKGEDEKVIGAEVLAKNISNNSIDNDMIYDDNAFHIKLKENQKIKGRYEGELEPGNYSITIKRHGYAVFTKDMDFISAENIVNLKIEREIEYNLKVKVISYDKFKPVINAQLKLKCGIDDTEREGVTNDKGKFKFIMNSREDFATLYIERVGYFPCQRTLVRNSTIADCKKGLKLTVLLIPESICQKDHSVIMVTYSNNIDENFVPVYSFSRTFSNYTDITYSDLQKEYGLMTSYFNFHAPLKEEKDEIEQNQEIEEFEEILRLTLQVKSENLLAQYKINPTVYMNGLRKFSCESCIYTAKNVFYISSPHYRKEINSTYWDLGYLDIKNLIFYETNILSLNAMDRTLHFSEWTNFLQVLIDKKLLANLFEVFNFNKGVLSHKDRILHELGFFKSLRNVIDGKEFSSEFAVFLSDMMKNENNYVSYTIMKKKISSNLKNFMDNLKLSISS